MSRAAAAVAGQDAAAIQRAARGSSRAAATGSRQKEAKGNQSRAGSLPDDSAQQPNNRATEGTSTASANSEQRPTHGRAPSPAAQQTTAEITSRQLSSARHTRSNAADSFSKRAEPTAR